MKPNTTQSGHIAILGAGPAGLTAGYLLSKKGYAVTVFEADPTYVGGISRTEKYKGYGFDIGGHRFFSKSDAVEALWTEILPDDFLQRPRSSRIYYNGQFFSYPLKAFEALTKLGFWESVRCVLSYTWAKLKGSSAPARNFEEWVSRHFGWRLYSIFFKTYTEKVWGMKCDQISADWAAQRIKGLSLFSVIWHAFFPAKQGKNRKDTIKTLIDSFRYPRKGPGMMWEAAAKKITENGGQVLMGQRVRSCELRGEKWAVEVEANGVKTTHENFDHVISSVPLRELMQSIRPAASAKAVASAAKLKYRDFLIVALVLRDRNVFSDNWIYIHDPSVNVGRIQNFKSWSPEMIPDPKTTCYGMEYFCFEGDGLWASTDPELIAMAKRELVKLGLASHEDILDAAVVRQKKAYPVYDDVYQQEVAVIRDEIAAKYPGLHVVGRNGMHKYNNQDHAMMTAMLTVENIVAGKSQFDIWQVNQDAEYHEEASASAKPGLGERLVPMANS